MYKKIGEVIPVASLLIVIIGLMKQWLYFNNYNIEIKYFLGISEIAMSISNDLFVLIPSVIGFLIFVSLFSNDIVTTGMNNEKNGGKNWKATTIGVLVIISLVTLVFGLFQGAYYYRIAFFGSSLLFLAVGIELVFAYNPSILNGPIQKFYIVGLVFLFAMIFILSGSQIEEVEKGKYSGTIIKTTDSIYLSNEQSYFIGKTDKYVFIFNKRNETTSIIPSESITNIILKAN